MAFGPRPHFVEELQLEGYPPQFAVVVAMEAAAQLGWEIHYLSETGLLGGVRKKPTQLQVRIGDGRMQILSHSLVSELWDGGRNKAHVRAFRERFRELQTQIPPDAIVARYEAVAPAFVAPQWDALRAPQRPSSGLWPDLKAVFTASRGYLLTPFILNLNVLVFLLMIFTGVSPTEPDAASLIAWGANGPRTLQGEWWRLLTSTFLHIGIIHLATNMYAFLLIGTQLEPRLGTARFGLAYLLSGIAGSAFSVWLHGGAHLSAGASGAIFGMYGVFVPLLLSDVVEERNRRQLRASMLFFIAYNLLGGIAPGIDNAGHIGGLVMGFLCGLAFIPPLRRKQRQAAEAALAAERASQPDGEAQPVVPARIGDYY